MKIVLYFLCFTALLFSGAQAAKFANDFNVTWGKQNVNITSGRRGDVVTLKLTKEKGNQLCESIEFLVKVCEDEKFNFVKTEVTGIVYLWISSSPSDDILWKTIVRSCEIWNGDNEWLDGRCKIRRSWISITLAIFVWAVFDENEADQGELLRDYNDLLCEFTPTALLISWSTFSYYLVELLSSSIFIHVSVEVPEAHICISNQNVDPVFNKSNFIKVAHIGGLRILSSVFVCGY